MLLIWHLGTNLGEILIDIIPHVHQENTLVMSSAARRSFSLGLHVLTVVFCVCFLQQNRCCILYLIKYLWYTQWMNLDIPFLCSFYIDFRNALSRFTVCVCLYPMLRADSRFWLVNNRGIWRRISRLTSSASDIKTKERHWWRHNGDSDRRPLSLPLRYDLVTLCLCGDIGQINVIAGNLKLRKRFRMSQILFEHGINSLLLVCFPGYGNFSTLSIAISRLAFGRAWYCDAACG